MNIIYARVSNVKAMASKQTGRKRMYPAMNGGKSTTYHGNNRDELAHTRSFWADLPQILFIPTLPWVILFEFTATAISLIDHFAMPTVEFGTMAQVIYSVLSIPLGYFLNSYISIALERYRSGGQGYFFVLAKLKDLTGTIVTSIHTPVGKLTEKEVAIIKRLQQLIGALPYAIREKFAHPIRGAYTPSNLSILDEREIFPNLHGVGASTNVLLVHELPSILIHKMQSDISLLTKQPVLKDYQGSYFLFNKPGEINELLASIEANETVTVPAVYSNFLFVLVFIYLLLLPLFIPASVHWWIALIIQPVATYMLMGMYILGSSMREPFENRHSNPFSHEDTHGQAAKVEAYTNENFTRLLIPENTIKRFN